MATPAPPAIFGLVNESPELDPRSTLIAVTPAGMVQLVLESEVDKLGLSGSEQSVANAGVAVGIMAVKSPAVASETGSFRRIGSTRYPYFNGIPEPPQKTEDRTSCPSSRLPNRSNGALDLDGTERLFLRRKYRFRPQRPNPEAKFAVHPSIVARSRARSRFSRSRTSGIGDYFIRRRQQPSWVSY